MVEISANHLLTLLAAYGYWAVLGLVAVESMGFPLPGESMLLLAATYAGTTHHLRIGLLIAAAAAGAVLGDNLGYAAGRIGGHRLLQRYGSRLGLDTERLRLGEYLFRRHGGKAVFFGRFVAFLRVWAAFLAGSYRMPWRRFSLCNLAGGTLWAALMGTAGYVFGATALRLGGTVGLVSGALGILLMIALAFALRCGERRWQHEANRHHAMSVGRAADSTPALGRRAA